MPPLCSAKLSGVVGLHWTESWWGSWPFTPLRTSAVSSGVADWSSGPWVHWPPRFSVSLWGGGREGDESDVAMPLDKWEEPFKQLLVYSVSEELLRETAGLFWVGEEVAFGTGGFTLIGRRSIPEATRFSIRPPRISIAPVEQNKTQPSTKDAKKTLLAKVKDLCSLPCQAYRSRSSWVNGARAKVKPIPERPIAYAVANLFRKYRAMTTEKDWYSSAKPIPKWKELLSKNVSVKRESFTNNDLKSVVVKLFSRAPLPKSQKQYIGHNDRGNNK